MSELYCDVIQTSDNCQLNSNMLTMENRSAQVGSVRNKIEFHTSMIFQYLIAQYLPHTASCMR